MSKTNIKIKQVKRSQQRGGDLSGKSAHTECANANDANSNAKCSSTRVPIGSDL